MIWFIAAEETFPTPVWVDVEQTWPVLDAEKVEPAPAWFLAKEEENANVS